MLNGDCLQLKDVPFLFHESLHMVQSDTFVVFEFIGEHMIVC